MVGKHAARMLVGSGVAGVVLGAASWAWACTAQLPFTVKPAAAPPLAAVTVSGGATAPGAVEVRWNGVDGPVLARAEAGSAFAVGVRVPDAPAGVHTLVAVTRDGDGTVLSTGKASFEVTGPGGTSVLAGTDHWRQAGAAREVVAGPASGLSPFALGTGMLGFGSAALVAGFGVAAARRRKAPATAVAPR